MSREIVDHKICVDKLAAKIAQNQAERSSPFVESPYFPNLLFKKNDIHQRLERENAEPWENIVDYLNRRYRRDQLSKKNLALEFGVTIPTVKNTIVSVGIPIMHSSEYKNPQTRALVAEWENIGARLKRTEGMRKGWRENREELLAKIQSPQAKELRGRSIARVIKENPELKSGRLINALQVKRANDWSRMEAILGEDPVGRMRSLLVDKGLGVVAATAEIGDTRLTPETLQNWVEKYDVFKHQERAKNPGINRSRADAINFCMANTNLWVDLPERQRQALSCLKDGDKIRKLGEISVIMGISIAAAGQLLTHARTNLEKLKRGEGLPKRGRRKKIID